MTLEKPIYIVCPGCECAIVELSTLCPNCRRCAFCGQKFKERDQCTCGYWNDPEKAAWYIAKYSIPEKEIPRERRRMEIRKQLETKETIAGALFAGVPFAAGPILRDLELFGPKTVANFWGMVIGTVIAMLSAHWSVRKVFRRIENRRLESEFPSAPPTR